MLLLKLERAGASMDERPDRPVSMESIKSDLGNAQVATWQIVLFGAGAVSFLWLAITLIMS